MRLLLVGLVASVLALQSTAEEVYLHCTIESETALVGPDRAATSVGEETFLLVDLSAKSYRAAADPDESPVDGVSSREFILADVERPLEDGSKIVLRNTIDRYSGRQTHEVKAILGDGEIGRHYLTVSSCDSSTAEAFAEHDQRKF